MTRHGLMESLGIHSSWDNTFLDIFKSGIMGPIRDVLKPGTYTPEERNIFRAFTTPLDEIKVVILGQDPYYTPGVAIGLAFAVSKDSAIPPSLRTIIKVMGGDLNNYDITLKHLTTQGVLLLNTALTTQLGIAGAHTKVWKLFTTAIIKALSQKDYLIWALWGNHAKSYIPLINDNHAVLTAGHPSPLAMGAKDPFKDCNHFEEVNNLLIKDLKQPIKWI